MAKITKFGTISGSLDHLTYSGFQVDAEDDESIYKFEEFGECSSQTFNHLKIAEVIITSAIDKLNKDLAGVRAELLNRESV